MNVESEINSVFVGDIAFNTDITPQKEHTSIGGAAYYSAVGAVAAIRAENLYSTAGIVASVGADFDLSFLIKKNIDLQGLAVVADEKTCQFTIIQHQDNTRDFKAERFVAEEVNTAIFPRTYSYAKFIHLATSLPQNYLIWMKFLADDVSNAKVSVDAFESFARQFPELTIEALNKADMIFINEEEANILSRRGTLRTDIPWILKYGAGGASYLKDSKEIKVAAPQVTTVETTGAGDILAGAFLALLSHYYKVEQALTIAVSLASQSITQFGVEHLASES